jgi:hypothetical protein
MDMKLAKIRRQALAEAIRITQHAQKEMDEEDITLDDVLAAIANGQILEDYAEHRRGPAVCLLAMVPTSVLSILFVPPHYHYLSLLLYISLSRQNGLVQHKGDKNEV